MTEKGRLLGEDSPEESYRKDLNMMPSAPGRDGPAVVNYCEDVDWVEIHGVHVSPPIAHGENPGAGHYRDAINRALSPLVARAAMAERMEKALRWFISEVRLAHKKGYTITEQILERCMDNGEDVLKDWDSLQGEKEKSDGR